MISTMDRKGIVRKLFRELKMCLMTFSPKINVQMEIYKFRQYKQKDDQTLNDFVTELRSYPSTVSLLIPTKKSSHNSYKTVNQIGYDAEHSVNLIKSCLTF